MSSVHPCVLGVDIGGTQMRVVALDRTRAIVVGRATTPTLPTNGPEDGLRRLNGLIEQVMMQAGLAHSAILGIGIGCTGPLDVERGLIQNPFTLPTWDDMPIVARIQQNWGWPVILLNDAQAAALGEYHQGAGQGTRHMAYITISTGIGGGFVLGGRLYQGYGALAGEVGHHSLNFDGPTCYCGQRGCWEMYAAGPAIAATARQQATPNSLLWQMAQGDTQRITGQMVGRAAEQGDDLARDILRDAGRYIGLGVANLLNILSPECFVLGGGVLDSHAFILPAVRETVARQQYAVGRRAVRIERARLGDDAGAVGAAYALIRHTSEPG